MWLLERKFVSVILLGTQENTFCLVLWLYMSNLLKNFLTWSFTHMGDASLSWYSTTRLRLHPWKITQR